MTTLPPLGHRLEMAFGRGCPTIWLPDRALKPGVRPFRSMQNTGEAAIVAFKFSSLRTCLLLAQYAHHFSETETHIIRTERGRMQLDRVPGNLLFEISLEAASATTREIPYLGTEKIGETELYRIPIAAGFNRDYIGPFFPEDREGEFDLLLPSEYHPYRSPVEI